MSRLGATICLCGRPIWAARHRYAHKRPPVLATCRIPFVTHALRAGRRRLSAVGRRGPTACLDCRLCPSTGEAGLPVRPGAFHSLCQPPPLLCARLISSPALRVSPSAACLHGWPSGRGDGSFCRRLRWRPQSAGAAAAEAAVSVQRRRAGGARPQLTGRFRPPGDGCAAHRADSRPASPSGRRPAPLTGARARRRLRWGRTAPIGRIARAMQNRRRLATAAAGAPVRPGWR